MNWNVKFTIAIYYDLVEVFLSGRGVLCDGTSSEINVSMLRSAYIKFEALVCSVTISSKY